MLPPSEGNAEAVVASFRDISPTMVESAYRQMARAFLYSADPALNDIIKEIKKNTGAVLEAEKERADLVADAELARMTGERDDGADDAAAAA